MQETEVLPGFREYWKSQAQGSPPRNPLQTDYCPSLPRLRRGVLNPQGWTEAEKKHLEGCAYCQGSLQAFERKVQHPKLWDLLAWRLGNSAQGETEAIREHVEDAQCILCNRLARSSWFQGLLKAAQAGGTVLEKTQRTLRKMPMVTGIVPMPMGAGALAFANERQKAFSWTKNSDDGTLSVTLMESEVQTIDAEPGDLVAFIDADAAYAGHILRLVILAEAALAEPLQAEVILEARRTGSGARFNFGPFSKVAARISETPVFTAMVTDQTEAEDDHQ